MLVPTRPQRPCLRGALLPPSCLGSGGSAASILPGGCVWGFCCLHPACGGWGGGSAASILKPRFMSRGPASAFLTGPRELHSWSHHGGATWPTADRRLRAGARAAGQAPVSGQPQDLGSGGGGQSGGAVREPRVRPWHPGQWAPWGDCYPVTASLRTANAVHRYARAPKTWGPLARKILGSN